MLFTYRQYNFITNTLDPETGTNTYLRQTRIGLDILAPSGGSSPVSWRPQNIGLENDRAAQGLGSEVSRTWTWGGTAGGASSRDSADRCVMVNVVMVMHTGARGRATRGRGRDILIVKGYWKATLRKWETKTSEFCQDFDGLFGSSGCLSR